MWQRRCLLVLFLCLGCGWSIGNGRAAGSAPSTFQMPDEAIMTDPSLGYPDAQRMADVSGTVTAIFRARAGARLLRADRCQVRSVRAFGRSSDSLMK